MKHKILPGKAPFLMNFHFLLRNLYLKKFLSSYYVFSNHGYSYSGELRRATLEVVVTQRLFFSVFWKHLTRSLQVFLWGNSFSIFPEFSVFYFFIPSVQW